MSRTFGNKIVRKIVCIFLLVFLSINVIFVNIDPVYAENNNIVKAGTLFAEPDNEQLVHNDSGGIVCGSSIPAEKNVSFYDFIKTYETEIVIAVLIFILLVACVMAYIIMIQVKSRNALFKVAYFDELTGIGNLNKFRIDAKNILAKAPKESYDIVCFDVKEFKLINDMFGYENGNKVLLNIVWAVQQNMLEGELLARMSSDNFIMLVEHDDAQLLIEDKQKMLNSFEILNSFDDITYNISFSGGAYSIRKDDDINDIDSMIDKALMAHKIAKRMESNAVVFYDDKIRDDALVTKEIENAMEKALAAEEFKLFLQPKYRLNDEKIVGAEALVRWKTDDGKMIFPDSFIPLFEQNGFVLKLDMYMLRKSCQKLREWIDKGITPVPISVNFSRNHFKDELFVKNVLTIVKEYSIPSNLIEIELTESTMIANEKNLQIILKQLHSEGVTLSMDDFGIGYSSLGLLKNLSVDVIKIDKSFFDESSNNSRAWAVVASVIELAKRLNIHTVAEGIETKENVDLLKSLSCDTVQGYYYAKPMQTDEFDLLMEH